MKISVLLFNLVKVLQVLILLCIVQFCLTQFWLQFLQLPLRSNLIRAFVCFSFNFIYKSRLKIYLLYTCYVYTSKAIKIYNNHEEQIAIFKTAWCEHLQFQPLPSAFFKITVIILVLNWIVDQISVNEGRHSALLSFVAEWFHHDCPCSEKEGIK